MIGGPPVFVAPPVVTMLPPGYGPVPYAPPPTRPTAPVRVAQAPAPRPAVVRGQMPEEAAMLAMPSPDQLGVSVRTANGVCDWSAIHQRMQELGVISFQMDRLNTDVYQITCLLPTAEAGRTHRIEAHGATEAEAMRCALDEAQRWKNQR